MNSLPATVPGRGCEEDLLGAGHVSREWLRRCTHCRPRFQGGAAKKVYSLPATFPGRGCEGVLIAGHDQIDVWSRVEGRGHDVDELRHVMAKEFWARTRVTWAGRQMGERIGWKRVKSK